MLLVLESDTSVIEAVATLDMVLLLCIRCNQQQLASWQVSNKVTVLNILSLSINHGNDHGDGSLFCRGLQGSRPKHPSAATDRQNVVVMSCS
jgi:hypothetical protein